MPDFKQHFFQGIFGFCDFYDLYMFVLQQAPQNAHFVEVGVLTGRSAAFMAVEIINSGKNIRFDLVDLWDSVGVPELLQDGVTNQLGVSVATDGPDCLFDLCKRNLEPVKDLVTFVRMSSVNAAACYDDNSLDFVFIDACHETEFVKADINAWWPKIKTGGIIAGHDYYWTQVQPAVDELLPGVAVWGNSWMMRKG